MCRYTVPYVVRDAHSTKYHIVPVESKPDTVRYCFLRYPNPVTPFKVVIEQF